LLGWRFGHEDVQQRLQQLSTEQAPKGGEAVVQPTTGDAAEAHVVTMMDGFDFLGETKLFGQLSLEETKAIYHSAEQTHYEPGQVLIEQDQPGRALLILRSGTAHMGY